MYDKKELNPVLLPVFEYINFFLEQNFSAPIPKGTLNLLADDLKIVPSTRDHKIELFNYFVSMIKITHDGEFKIPKYILVDQAPLYVRQAIENINNLNIKLDGEDYISF